MIHSLVARGHPMRDIREYGNGPTALLAALTELGIDPRLVWFTPYETEAVRGCTRTWQETMEQQVALPQEEMCGGSYAPRVILIESENGWRVVRASHFLTPVDKVLRDQGIAVGELTRIVLVEHHPAEPWDVCMPYGATPSLSFFYILVARREP